MATVTVTEIERLVLDAMADDMADLEQIDLALQAWSNPLPLAATALRLGLPLVTADHRIRTSGLSTIW